VTVKARVGLILGWTADAREDRAGTGGALHQTITKDMSTMTTRKTI